MATNPPNIVLFNFGDQRRFSSANYFAQNDYYLQSSADNDEFWGKILIFMQKTSDYSPIFTKYSPRSRRSDDAFIHAAQMTLHSISPTLPSEGQI